jgi:hypothetical protein
MVTEPRARNATNLQAVARPRCSTGCMTSGQSPFMGRFIIGILVGIVIVVLVQCTRAIF